MQNKQITLGRNDLCWCGSNKKYKKCHLNRSKEPRPTIQEGKSILKSAFSKAYCLHPEATENCKGNIVKAHSIQRNGGLSKIAVNGHVGKISLITHYNSNVVKYEKSLIGLKKASTFTGFCGYHDSSVFSDIENHRFLASKKQIFLLAYRSICRELFFKVGHLEVLKEIKEKDKGLPFDMQIHYQESINAMIYGCSLGLETMKKQKRKYDKILISKSFSKVNYYVVMIDSIPDVLCSGTHIPEIDFNGKFYLQLGYANIDQEIMTFNSIPIDNGGAIIFSNCDNGNVSKGFYESLIALDSDELPNTIIRYIFEYFENAFFSPKWWDLLDNKKQNQLLQKASHGSRPDSEHDTNCLLPDGFSYVDWNVRNKLEYFAC